MEAKEKNVALIYLKVFFVPLTVYITSIGKMHLAKIDISLFMVLFWIMNQTEKKTSVLHILNGQLRKEEEEEPTHKNMQISGKSIEKEITGKNEVEWKKKFYEWMGRAHWFCPKNTNDCQKWMNDKANMK